MSVQLVWFRADLRVSDNTALAAACRVAKAAGGGVDGLFVICPKQWARHDWSGVRVDFMLRTLRVLSDDLAKIKVPLLIRTAPGFAETPELIERVAREVGASGVHWNKEYEINEVERDERVRERLEAGGFGVSAYTDQVLVEPGEVRTGEGRCFTVFSPFKRALYRVLESSPVRVVETPGVQKPVSVERSAVPSAVEGFVSRVDPGLWRAGEHEAVKRLEWFVANKIRVYKQERDFPALDSTSALSPYLAIGAISPRRCVVAALEANGGKYDGGNEGAAHWISEVAWREFYKHILIGFPRVCKRRAFKPETEQLQWNDDEEAFAAWCEGRTGVPLVDAGMRSLVATGWLHNRLRMVVAMYLTKDLFIDWRKGEKFFMQNLVDGDLGPNNGGWQWSASTGTDAAPYFRIFNPISQSRKFDPDGVFIKRWVPELRELSTGEDGDIHDPAGLPVLLRGTIDYPEPLVDRTKVLDRVKQAFAALSR